MRRKNHVKLKKWKRDERKRPYNNRHFSAIYFVINFAFMLMAAKVQKPGAVFLMGLITALIYFATGQFTLVIRGITKYGSFKGNSISYVIFSLGMVGSPLPIWLFKADFLAQITEQGLIIPLSVTIRYFPALKEEVGYIRDAMKLRNIRGMHWWIM